MYNTIKIETVKNGSQDPYTAVIFPHGKEPKTKTHPTIKEAKQWCADNSIYEDDAWAVLDNGRCVVGGIIDGMFEGDDEEDDN